MVDRFSFARQLAFVATLTASLLLGGCKEKAEASTAQPTPPSAPPAPKASASAAAAAAPAAARVETPEYVVALAAGPAQGTVHHRQAAAAPQRRLPHRLQARPGDGDL
jgi:hypothetical protein